MNTTKPRHKHKPTRKSRSRKTMRRDYQTKLLLKKWRDYCNQTGVRSTNVQSMTLSRSDRWNIHIQALSQYAARTGSSLVPTTHIESVAGKNIALGSWVAYNRQQRRQGRLSRERIEELSAFTGWRWDKQKPGKHDNPERDLLIVNEYKSGVSARDLADKYRLSRQRVHQIVRNKKVR